MITTLIVEITAKGKKRDKFFKGKDDMGDREDEYEGLLARNRKGRRRKEGELCDCIREELAVGGWEESHLFGNP